MRIGIANDHAGTALKHELVQYLTDKGYDIIDYGTDSYTASDYPLQGELLANGVRDHEVDLGVAICGTGLGIGYACNKVRGIRAAMVSETTSARLSREHNDANIICIGARIVGLELAKDIVDIFLETPFSGQARHQKRIDMIREIEERQ